MNQEKNEKEIYSLYLREAPREYACENIQKYLEKGADINSVDASGKTALHISIEYNKIDCIKILLENNADVHIQDEEGNTPLHLAVLDESTEIMELLLENGADKDIFTENNDYKTPWDIAEETSEKSLELLEYYDLPEANMKLNLIKRRQKREERQIQRYEAAANRAATNKAAANRAAVNKAAANRDAYLENRRQNLFSVAEHKFSSIRNQINYIKSLEKGKLGGKRKPRKTRKSKKARKSKKTRKH